MKSMRKSLSVSLCLRSICVALLCLALAGSASAATPQPGRATAEAVWITLGADAFASIVVLPDVRFENQPLERVAQVADVVLTRVHGADLARISDAIHQAHRRCAGFITHSSLARAQEELQRLAGDGARQEPSGVYTIDQTPLVHQLEAALEEAQILDTIDSLSNDFNNRYHSNPAGTAAATWIRNQWLAFAAGRDDVTVEFFNHSGTIQPSVVLTIDGVELPDEVVVLGSHLDSRVFDGGDPDDPNYLAPGADDDASGIAVLSEVIRVAMAQNFRPRRTVQFMGYAAEEVGLVGSGEIADAYQTAGVDVVGVLQLDMTGYFGSDEDMGVLSEQWTDSALTTFVTELITFYQPSLLWATTQCGYGCSDHASWDANGYPAAMAFESLFGEHNPEIHTIDDTVATLGNSAAHAYKFARLGAAFMAEVAKETSEVFADGFETGTTERWSVIVP